MSQQSQKFCTSHAKSSTWTPGLRTFFEYRDLGIGDATHGQFNAHVIRVKKPVEQFPHRLTRPRPRFSDVLCTQRLDQIRV